MKIASIQGKRTLRMRDEVNYTEKGEGDYEDDNEDTEEKEQESDEEINLEEDDDMRAIVIKGKA